MAVEIERKFLVPVLPDDLPQGKAIRQGYIQNEPGKTVRVRTKGDRGFLTVKGSTGDMTTRNEFEYEIPLADALALLENFCEKPLIEKTRYTVRINGFEWVIDVFYGDNQGLRMAEIELTSPDQSFDLPAWAGEEVTHDPRYFNASLINHPFSAW